MAKVQLGVIFGSRSCEREVSIISAVQLMNHVDSEKYDVIPVYIGENGVWYTGNALRRIETYTPFDPNKAGIEAVALDVTAGSGALLANRPGKGLFSHPTQVVVARLEVCVIVMHGLNGEDGTLQGMLELANLPYTSTGVAGSAIGMDKIMMKQFFRGAGRCRVCRIAGSRAPCISMTKTPCWTRWRRNWAIRCSSSPRTLARPSVSAVRMTAKG